MQDPKESYSAVLKQALRYLCGTTSLGLMYIHTRLIELVGYSDSSHNDDIDDDKSTRGYVLYNVQSYIMVFTEARDQCILFLQS